MKLRVARKADTTNSRDFSLGYSYTYILVSKMSEISQAPGGAMIRDPFYVYIES
jgi:uncharacterized protein (DUF4213/DUF364 family)